MANHEEPMDIDSLECDFDNKENTYRNNVVPCTEKGYEELDVSELNMKLRYSITPAASPMSKSFTNYTRNLDADDSLNYSVNESNLTRSLNSNITRNENVIKSLKTLPLQSRPTDQTDRTVIRQSDCVGLSNDPNITVTVSGHDDENISLPSSSSSLLHTPEATTPTKDPEKNENDSPIMRGLKSVLNIFRSSQSPIPPADNENNHISPKPEQFAKDEKSEKVSASTPIAPHRSKDTGSKRNSPYKESLTFNEDLEKELQWKDETTIFFGQEKIPVHKLFLTKPNEPQNKTQPSQNQNLNNTVEYMDISFNDTIGDRTLTETLPKTDTNTIESDGEFEDCETTFTKDHQDKSVETKQPNETVNINNKSVPEHGTETQTQIDTTFETKQPNETFNINDIHVSSKFVTEHRLETEKQIDATFSNGSENKEDNIPLDEVCQVMQANIDKKPKENKTDSDTTFTKVIEVKELQDKLEENVTETPQVDVEPKLNENKIEGNTTFTQVKELQDEQVVKDPEVITGVKIEEKLTQDHETIGNVTEITDSLQDKATVGSENQIPLVIPEQNTEISNVHKADESVTQINDNTQVVIKKTETVVQADLLQGTEEVHKDEKLTEVDEKVTSNENSLKLDLTQDISMDYDNTYTNNETICIRDAAEHNAVQNITNEQINTTIEINKTEILGQETDPSDVGNNNKVNDGEQKEQPNETTASTQLGLIETAQSTNLLEKTCEEEGITINSLENIESNKPKDFEFSPIGPLNDETDETMCVTPENYIQVVTPGAPRPPSDIALPDDFDEYPYYVPDIDIMDDIRAATSEAMALVENLYNERTVYFMEQSALLALQNEAQTVQTHSENRTVKSEEIEDKKITLETTTNNVHDNVDKKPNEQASNLNNTEEHALDVIETARVSEMLPDLLNQTVTVQLEEIRDNLSHGIITAAKEITNNAAIVTNDSSLNQDQQIVNGNETKSDNKSIENNPYENNDNKIIHANHQEQMNATYSDDLDKNREISEVTLYSDNIMKTICTGTVEVMSNDETEKKNVNESIKTEDFNTEDQEIISILNKTREDEIVKTVQEVPVNSLISENSNDSKVELNDKIVDSTFNLNKTQDKETEILLPKTPEDKEITENLLAEKEKSVTEETMTDELITSENNSPYVSVSADLDKVSQNLEVDNLETIPNTNRSNSPPISSKGYNFNFDEIDDPFATKTAIRMSPTPDTPNRNIQTMADTKTEESPKKFNQNKRKSHSERKKPNFKKNNKTSQPSKILKDQTFDISDSNVIDTEPTVPSADSNEIIEKTVTEDEKLSQTCVLDTTVEIQKDTNSDKEKTPQPTRIEANKFVDSAGTSSGFKSRNVFNIPEIDDMNFNPFVTKSKMCQSPPTVLDDNPFATKSKIRSSPDSSLVIQKNDVKNTEHVLSSTHFIEKDSEDKMETEAMEKDTSPNTTNCTFSSKSNDNDTTAREIHTEDEDTIEGPFLDLDDDDDANVTIEEKLKKHFKNRTENEENAEGELFIDAEAFEFLLNQNTNIVADSGKESLFLKFDPLFAQRMSTGGVAAALNNIKKQTPQTESPQIPANSTFNAGPSNLNITLETDYSAVEGPSEDLNVTVTKPMMVVTPAVNPVPTRKSVTPTRPNRRSITFTSPAMAVIDRLLSLSGNNSVLEQEPSQISPERNDADLALIELREMLAEKEIHVHTLRAESKDLRERLTNLESQMKMLETEGQQRLQKINDLNEKLTEKTKINRSMAAVVEEYERTIASLIADTEQDKKRHAEERIALINERDEQTAHLASMEVSFNDLHSKYEKSKQVILSYKANEEKYKVSLKEMEENVTKMQKNYELLKQHATSKLNHANDELQKLNRAHEAEVVKLNAMIKRKELHITSLEETLAQKTKANEELTAICDELINKVG